MGKLTHFSPFSICLISFFLLVGCSEKVQMNFQHTTLSDPIQTNTSLATPHEIAIGSYNLFLRSKLINLKQENNARGQQIGQWIKESGLDVIALQETWDAEAMAQLIRQVKGTMPYYTINQPIKQRGTLLNGGLSIFSKFPILNYQFAIYEDCSGTDCLAAKGFTYVLLELNQQQSLHLINTHLDAGEKAKDRTVRKRQLEQIAAFVHTLDLEEGPLLLVGDFNINRLGPSSEYAELLTTLNLVEYQVEQPATLNCEHTSTTCKDGYIPKQLDFIFQQKDEQRICRASTQHYDLATNIGNSYYLSDHKAVVSTFQINSPKSIAALKD